MMNKRDTSVDIAKGICILLIVCIHTELFEYVRNPFTFIAVPMFFFMSGFYDKSGLSYDEWFYKHIRTLLIPVIIWCFIGISYSYILQSIKGDVSPYNFNVYNQCEGNGPTWFLFALFYAKLFTTILTRTKLNSLQILLICICVGYGGASYELPLLIDEGLAALPLYYSGTLYKGLVMKTTSRSHFILNGIGVLSILAFVLQYVGFTIVPLHNSCFKPYYMVAILCIMVSFFPILSFSKKMNRNKLLEELGKHSLGIMLIHTLVCHTFAVVINRMVEKHSIEWMILFGIAYFIIVAISYEMTIIVEKYSPFLFGKKA